MHDGQQIQRQQLPLRRPSFGSLGAFPGLRGLGGFGGGFGGFCYGSFAPDFQLRVPNAGPVHLVKARRLEAVGSRVGLGRLGGGTNRRTFDHKHDFESKTLKISRNMVGACWYILRHGNLRGINFQKIVEAQKRGK